MFLFFYMMANVPLLLHLLLHHVVDKLRYCVPIFRNLQNNSDSILFIIGTFALLIIVFITICYSCSRTFNSKSIWARTSSKKLDPELFLDKLQMKAALTSGLTTTSSSNYGLVFKSIILWSCPQVNSSISSGQDSSMFFLSFWVYMVLIALSVSLSCDF